MKKISLLLLLLLSYCSSFAQTVSFSLTTAPCNNNGVLQASVTGMSGTITYTFHKGVGVASILAVNTTGTLTGYSGVPIWLTVTNGTSSASGIYGGAPPFNYSVGSVTATCPAVSTATVAITGGTSPYTVQWFNNNTTTLVATGTTASLAQGEYDVLITDANGCVYGSNAKDDSIFVWNNSNLNFNVSGTPASCTNGTATITGITGGPSPYSYLWSNAATTPSISGLIRGYYNATVTDANGCATTRGVNIAQNPNINVNVTPGAATCLLANGSATAFASGGASPYAYHWNTTQTTQLVNGLSGNHSYYVTAIDANGCTGQGSVYIASSSPITATATATASSCTSATGTATVSATGGASPYTIVWSTYPTQTGTTATGLIPGLYNFTVTDANGCVRTGSVYVPPVSIITANAIASNTLCTAANGTASVTVSSGAAPYTYLWSTSATTSSITGLAAGGYSVRITDNMGCSVTKYASVGVSSPITVGMSASQASCIFTSNGSITATPSGGTAPYTYAWAGASSTTSTASSLGTGGYYVYVTDAAGCHGSGYAYVGYNASNTSCYCTVTGTVYNDANKNCTKDPGELGIPNIVVHLSGRGYTATNSAGVYSFQVPTGSYSLSQTVQSYYPLAPCQNNAIPVSVTAATGCSTTVNLADTVQPIHDIQVQTITFGAPPIPGYGYDQLFIVKNNGTDTEKTILAAYKHDGQLGTPVMPTTFAAAGTNSYRSGSSFPQLAPGATTTALVQYSTPTNIPINTSLDYKDSATHASPMSNWLTDYTPWDNVETYGETVVGSWDPNEMEVAPAGQSAQGFITTNDSVLTYTVHFQNTGNYPAQKIVVIDTLDANLDVASIKPFAASHNYKMDVSDGSNIATFTFNNINLPDSNVDKMGSMGYVIYTIHQKKGLALNTKIQANASIYFDYNAPVKTNTTLNTIKAVPFAVQSTGRPDELLANVYPNPASNKVMIAIESDGAKPGAQVKLISLTGQVLQQQQVSLKAGKNVFEASTAQLAPGFYLVEVTDGARVSTSRLSIVR